MVYQAHKITSQTVQNPRDLAKLLEHMDTEIDAMRAVLQTLNALYLDLIGDLWKPWPITSFRHQIGSTPANIAWKEFFHYNFVYGVQITEEDLVGEALTGSTIPQNKFGGWRIDVSNTGGVSFVEAADNATGYDDTGDALYAAKAVALSTEHCPALYISYGNSAGTLIPGTTALNGAGIDGSYSVSPFSLNQRIYTALTQNVIGTVTERVEHQSGA